MGFLYEGTPLAWKDSAKAREYVRQHGIDQFLSIWKRNKDREDLDFLWGDEVEGFLVVISDSKAGSGDQKRVKLSLRGNDILEAFEREADGATEEEKACGTCPASVIYHPEYGSFMIETTPSSPYGGFARDLQCVEANMRLRRSRLRQKLRKNELYSTLTTYPLMGVGAFTEPAAAAGGPVAMSKYVPDVVINRAKRFAALTANIRVRRGSNVNIQIPLLKDENTPESLGDFIDMDAMAFGMGCCCLQTTFLARNLSEARELYDHLAVLGPVMLALTAATPFFRGLVADTDARWSTIAQSVDDRTEAERGQVKGREQDRIAKSRYDSISSYIGQTGYFKPKYNDIKLEMDATARRRLVDGGIDELMADHVAHLWVRDPLVIYKERLEIDDSKEVDHFENIQSTNWQSVRFKPPPNAEIGWRVEFRTMEVQLSDFENAAFTVFIALLSRAILAFRLNLYLPISKVDENMERAHRRGAVLKQRFFWRQNMGPVIAEFINSKQKSALANGGSDDSESKACDSPTEEAKREGAKREGAKRAATDGKRNECFKSMVVVDEDNFDSKSTLDMFLQVPAKHRFVIVYGEYTGGNSWCPGCTRTLPLVENKIESFSESAALLKLPVKRSTYLKNSEHPYRLDKKLCVKSIPTLIRVSSDGCFEPCLDPKLSADSFYINQYMTQRMAQVTTRFINPFFSILWPFLLRVQHIFVF